MVKRQISPSLVARRREASSPPKTPSRAHLRVSLPLLLAGGGRETGLFTIKNPLPVQFTGCSPSGAGGRRIVGGCDRNDIANAQLHLEVAITGTVIVGE